MKKPLLFLLFTSLAFAGYSTTHTVVNSNFTFSPANITILSGDSVRFTLANIHTVIEVTEANWNNNDNTPMSGGFQLGNGGGLVLPAKLTAGTHWYVCGPHGSGGMKGKIIVEGILATDEPGAGLALMLSPNPTSSKFQVTWNNTNATSNYSIDVFDLTGQIILNTTGDGTRGLPQNVEINMAGYAKGIYIVRLRDEYGMRTKKLILQ